jgi:hypothetical protein
MTGTEIAVRAANRVEKATKKVDNEIARESRRQAESQGGTTIVVGITVPGPNPVVPLRPDGSPTTLGSPDSLPTFEALLDLPNRAAGPDDEEEVVEEEEDLGLAGLFRLPPHLEDVFPPSASAPEPRRSKRVMSIAGHYATLAGMSPRKARK